MGCSIGKPDVPTDKVVAHPRLDRPSCALASVRMKCSKSSFAKPIAPFVSRTQERDQRREIPYLGLAQISYR